MSGYTAYLELPSGERIEIPAEMPDVTEADGTLWDGSFELPESVKKLMEWADETAIEWGSDPYFLEGWLKPRRRINFNPPEHWEAVQTNAATHPRLDGAATYIKQGGSRVWQGAYISELPHTGAQRRMT